MKAADPRGLGPERSPATATRSIFLHMTCDGVSAGVEGVDFSLKALAALSAGYETMHALVGHLPACTLEPILQFQEDTCVLVMTHVSEGLAPEDLYRYLLGVSQRFEGLASSHLQPEVSATFATLNISVDEVCNKTARTRPVEIRVEGCPPVRIRPRVLRDRASSPPVPRVVRAVRPVAVITHEQGTILMPLEHAVGVGVGDVLSDDHLSQLRTIRRAPGTIVGERDLFGNNESESDAAEGQ